MSTNTIQELLNKGAFILEDPHTGLLNIGPLCELDSHTGRFVDYDLKTACYLSEPDYQLSREELLKAVASFKKSKGFREWSFSSKADYLKSFKEAKNCFLNTNLNKVILYRLAYAEVKNEFGTFFNSLSSLLSSNKNGYIYALINPSKSLYRLGLAPEFLFKGSKGSKYETIALAGTGGLDEELLLNSKLIKEHKAVEESISCELKNKVSWGEISEERHGHIKHLSSKGVLDIKREEVLSLAEKLHPTAAVGVMPKNFNLGFSPGPEPRGFYGGFAELLMDESSFALVLIRGLEIRDGEAKVFFGGGVIRESVLEGELKELEMKFENLKVLLDL